MNARRYTYVWKVLGCVPLLGGLVQLLQQHPEWLRGGRGLALLALSGLYLWGVLSLRLRSEKHAGGALWLRLGAMFLSAVGLSRLGPTGAFQGIVFICAGILGAVLPSRALLVATPAIVAAALWLGAEPAPPTANWFDQAFTLAASMGIAHLFIKLISQRERQEQLLNELQAAHAELKESAARMEELAVLHERARMARDLHDTLGHALTAITVQLEAAKRLAARDPVRLEGALREAQSLSRRALDDLRTSLSDLRSNDAAGSLQAALRRLATGAARRTGWRLDLTLDDGQINPDVARELERIAEEAIVNAERHADARRLEVTLRLAGGELLLRVGDDGVGFDPAAQRPGHFGLQGMHERAAALGARLEVASAQGAGTKIAVRLGAPHLDQVSGRTAGSKTGPEVNP